MIPFLVVALVMLAIACAWVLVPLLSRRRITAVDDATSNLSILRDQRAELEADLANGVISSPQYDAARIELERRVLEDVSASAVTSPETSRANAWTIAILGAGFPIAAILLYAVLGTPAALLPDAAQVASGDAQRRVSPQDIDTMIERVKERLATHPDDLQGWKVLARTYYVLGRAPEAAGAYGRAVALAPNDAELLADYADAVAIAQNGSLAGKPEAIVAQALRANPDQWKANALAGTLAFQRGDFTAAISHWERAKGVVPADSPAAQSIESSLAEARSRAQGAKAAATSTIRGTVSLSPTLAASVAPGDTLFVFARPADGSRMPLASIRATTRELPLAFTLDDAAAMMPNRKLSDFGEVLVGARISKSGNALAQSGDLEATLAPAKVGAVDVKLVIDRRVP